MSRGGGGGGGGGVGKEQAGGKYVAGVPASSGHSALPPLPALLGTERQEKREK